MPFWGAYSKYGWEKGEWAVGLEKEKVDALAAKDKEITIKIKVSRNNPATLYYIKAKRVQECPIEQFKGNTSVKGYIVRKGLLGFKVNNTDMSMEALAKLGVF